MRSIDNAYRAVAAALAERIDLSHLVATGWHKAAVTKLDGAIVRALGIQNADTTVDDIIPGALVETVTDLVVGSSSAPGIFIEGDDTRDCEDEYLDLIFRASEGNSENHLRHLRSRIRGAIRLSIAARLDCVTLRDRFERTPSETSFSFVTEVADYYRDYKQQCGLFDAADALTGKLEPIEACALCLIHRALPPLATQGLRRLLPKAFFCTVSIS